MVPEVPLPLLRVLDPDVNIPNGEFFTWFDVPAGNEVLAFASAAAAAVSGAEEADTVGVTGMVQVRLYRSGFESEKAYRWIIEACADP